MEDNKNAMGEMPTGLMSRIAHHTRAMDSYFSLSQDEQNTLMRFIESSATGAEAKSRVEHVVEALEKGSYPEIT